LSARLMPPNPPPTIIKFFGVFPLSGKLPIMQN
jgi:hypothetical protein